MPTIFSSLLLFVLQGGSLANSCPALKRFLITDINEKMISESVILFCIFLPVDIRSGLLALMEDLLLKRLNSAQKLTDIESDELARYRLLSRYQ